MRMRHSIHVVCARICVCLCTSVQFNDSYVFKLTDFFLRRSIQAVLLKDIFIQRYNVRKCMVYLDEQFSIVTYLVKNEDSFELNKSFCFCYPLQNFKLFTFSLVSDENCNHTIHVLILCKISNKLCWRRAHKMYATAHTKRIWLFLYDKISWVRWIFSIFIVCNKDEKSQKFDLFYLSFIYLDNRWLFPHSTAFQILLLFMLSANSCSICIS